MFSCPRASSQPQVLRWLLARGVSLDADAAAVTIKGSDTTVVLSQRWAEVYRKSHPGTAIQISGGGSGVGIAALLNGTTQIANESRPLRPEEIAAFFKKFKASPHVYKICLGGILPAAEEPAVSRAFALPLTPAARAGL